MSLPVNVDPVRGLERSPLFRGIPERTMHALSMFCEIAMLRDGDVLVRHGEAMRGVWLVLAGTLEVSLPREADPEGRPEQLEPGVLVGHVDLLNDAPSSATYTARGQVSLLAWGESSVRRLLKEDGPPGSAFRRALIISQANQLLAANQRMASYVQAHPDAARPSRGVLRDVALLVQGHRA